ncbi:MAG: glycosyltransferase, partial [Muribaculaceae bacterium]|nr:glycosyltransferase [Muribaculaceae bacterium]
MPCKVSIIIAVKNGGQFIAHTLESILSQDYPHIECVVVDGRSSDGTLDVVKSFEPRFAGRLKWVSDDDSGMYQAINLGIALSTGDILGILNSDDFYHRPDSVSTIVKRLEVGDVDAVYGDVRFVRGNDLDHT